MMPELVSLKLPKTQEVVSFGFSAPIERAIWITDAFISQDV